jgi:acetyl esterase/lipase
MDLTGSPEANLYGPGMVEMLERTVMKVKEAEHPEVFRGASPTFRVRADAPPFFVLHGANDTLVPVETARTFVRRLRAVSGAPVPGPARLRRPCLAPLPGHHLGRRRLPRRGPGRPLRRRRLPAGSDARPKPF